MPPRGCPEADGYTCSGADQMQAPAEELLLLCGTVAVVCAPLHLCAARGADAAAHRHRQRIERERGSTDSKLFTEQIEGKGEPVGEGVQAAVQARQRKRATQGVHPPQHAQGTLMVVGELGCRDHCHREYLAVTRHGTHITAMSMPLHQVVKQDKGRYNQCVVHRSLQASRRVQSTRIVRLCSMNGYPQSGLPSCQEVITPPLPLAHLTPSQSTMLPLPSPAIAIKWG